MNTHEVASNQKSASGNTQGSQQKHSGLINLKNIPIDLISLIFLGSLIMGLIPIISGFSATSTANQEPLVLGEAGVWSTLAVKD